MNATNIIAALNNATTTADFVSVNDAAVRVFRSHCAKRGYDRTAQGQLLREEVARITACKGDWNTYRHAKRTGSKFRLTRQARAAVFANLKTRESL